MNRIIFIMAILLMLSCSKNPVEPIPDYKYQVDSLQAELVKARFTANRRLYIIECNTQWFHENKIDPPCHGNPGSEL